MFGRCGSTARASLRSRHRVALPILPLAFSTSSVDADVVICNTSGFAHGIRTKGRKLVYCQSPPKWLYRRNDYLGVHPSKFAHLGLRLLHPYLRSFDKRAAKSADMYIANSTYIASHVRDVYGIDAHVLSPPTGLETEGSHEPIPGVEPGFLLIVARLMPYKNVSQVAEAFRDLPEQTLVVVGQGPEHDRLVAEAPPNVRFLGRVSDASLRWLYANSAGLIAASREDFGLTSVEASMFGKPVTALRWGGFLDTVTPETGVFFDAPEPAPIARAVERLLGRRWDANVIRKHAEAFSETRFIGRIQQLVDAMHSHQPASSPDRTTFEPRTRRERRDLLSANADERSRR